jgi:hypothetical protein
MCWICEPFSTADTCSSCVVLTQEEREARLTDTLIEEILIEEQKEFVNRALRAR